MTTDSDAKSTTPPDPRPCGRGRRPAADAGPRPGWGPATVVPAAHPRAPSGTARGLVDPARRTDTRPRDACLWAPWRGAAGAVASKNLPRRPHEAGDES